VPEEVRETRSQFAADQEAVDELYRAPSVLELIAWSEGPTRTVMGALAGLGVLALAIATLKAMLGDFRALLPAAVLTVGAPVACVALGYLSWERANRAVLRRLAAGLLAGAPLLKTVQAAYAVGQSGHERRLAMLLLQSLWDGDSLAEALGLLGVPGKEREELRQADSLGKMTRVLCEVTGVPVKLFAPRALAPAARMVVALLLEARELGADRMSLVPMSGPLEMDETELREGVRACHGELGEEYVEQAHEDWREMLAEPGLEAWAEVDGEEHAMHRMPAFICRPLLRHLKLLAGCDYFDEPPLAGSATVELPEGPTDIGIEFAPGDDWPTVTIAFRQADEPAPG
jgi:hypothetical protein